MKRLLHFDDEGFYVGEELVSSSYLKSKSNEYIAELNEEIAFHLPRLIDGELVEGKTEPDKPIEKPIVITYEDLLKQHILDLEFMLLIK